MKILYGIFALSLISLLGKIIEKYFNLLIPGDIIGIFILLIFILYKKSIPIEIEQATNPLLNNLGLLFVPAGVGIIAYLDFIQINWKIILFASILTTILGLIISAFTFIMLRKKD